MEASYFAKSYWGGNSSQNQHLANGGGRNSKLFHSVFTTKSRGAECGDISSSSSIISSGGAPNNGNFTGGSAPCMLVARLIRGAGMTRDGSAINVFVQLELYDPPMVSPAEFNYIRLLCVSCFVFRVHSLLNLFLGLQY